MALGIVAALGSGLLGAFGSNKAAKAQQAAAAAQTALEGRIYDETTERFQPFLGAGQNALAAYNFELGLGPRPEFGGTPQEIVEFSETIPGAAATHPGRYVSSGRDSVLADGSTPDQTRTGYRVGDQVFYDRGAADEYARANPTGATPYGGFQQTPWQNYLMDSGRDAIDASASVRGGLYSGETLKALSDFGQTTSNRFYENYLQRLGGLAAGGQAAAGNIANAGANYASGAGSAIAASGNAQAAGIVGGVNALNSGINNALGIWNYQNMQPGGNANPMSTPWAAPGFWG